MLIGVCSFFNEVDFLEASLKALKILTHKLVVVDGAYVDFPHKRPYSTDGSLEIAKRYADMVIETKETWQDEIEKRNQYLVGNDGDYYLMVDADEVIEGNIPKLTKDDYQIMLHRVNEKTPYPVYRIFKHRKGLQYWGTHHALWVDNELLNKKEMPIVQDCRLIHKMSLRDNERIEAKGIYYRALQIKEKKVRQKYGL